MRRSPLAAALLGVAVGIAAATALIAAAGTAGAAPLVEDDEECDVTAAESIQGAIDNASPYSRIVVCEATYYQNATIDKPGIELLGKGTPILDGTVDTANRTGLRVAEGVDDVTIYSFEIRHFDDPLNGSDTSSGIVLKGGHKNVTVWGNDIDDNAWTGLRSLTGPIEDVRVVDNKFDNHGFSHTFLHQIRNLTIRNNTAVSSDQAFVVSEGQNVTVVNNSVSGGGNGAYVFPPALDNSTWTTNLTFRNNTADGKWTHGVWALGLENATISRNNFTINGTDLTAGGLPEEVELHNNTADRMELTLNASSAYDRFEDTFSGTYTQSCSTCLSSTLEDLYEDALFVLLNPEADASDRTDFDKLEDCGGDDACLRSRFLQDDGPVHEWWVPGKSETPRLHFIDAGVRDRAPPKDTISFGLPWTRSGPPSSSANTTPPRGRTRPAGLPRSNSTSA